MTYFFETYGCQMNKAESAAIEQLLTARGWSAAAKAEKADLAILNTCSVRITAEQRIHGRLGWYLALKRNREAENPITIAVTGCMAERLKENLQKKFPVVDYVVGTFEKNRFVEIAKAIENHKTGKAQKNNAKITIHPPADSEEEIPTYSFAPLSYEKGAFQAFVPIMHGCNNFCAYCIVPYVRGREVSRAVTEILDEIDTLSANGVREITLLGQNVNSYTSKNTDFPDLLAKIATHLRNTNSPIGWVRFMSSHPKDVSEKLLEVIASERVLCRHLHLPVQHGSTQILQSMNRKYTREHYLCLIEKARAKLPDVSLSTDILIGFPSETQEDFEQTVSLIQEVRFAAAFMYYYNPREGTAAFSMKDQIALKVKKERLAKIVDLQLEITRTNMKKRLGTTITVLAERVSRDNKKELCGRTEHDERVVFAADKMLIGNFIKVTLIELTGNTFRAIININEALINASSINQRFPS